MPCPWQTTLILAAVVAPVASLQNASVVDGKPFAQVRFPYSKILVSHVPKTGGTSLRNVIEQICRARGQALQVCYGRPSCDYEIHAMHWDNFVLFDPLSENQVVYGHMVKADFPKYWSLDPTNIAQVRMLRDPCALMVSNHGHHCRSDGWCDTFEDFIRSGQMEERASAYLRYFIEAPAINKPELLREQIHAAAHANRTLTLSTDLYAESVRRLVLFLGGSKHEADHFVSAIPTLNYHPQGVQNVSVEAFQMMQRVLAPLDLLYSLVTASFEAAPSASFPRTVKSSRACVLVAGVGEEKSGALGYQP